MTKEQIPSRISMPCPFGGFGSTNITEIEKTSGNNVNFIDGFPSVYGAPSSNNGKFVTRKEMNAIGNLASRDLFYHKCGGLNTFDPQFCAAIGGYPKGAILQYPVANQIFEVMSLIDNNTIDFTNSNSGVSGITNGSVDGINWVYCNKEIPTTSKVLLSSGDTSLGSEAATMLDIVEIPASGYIVSNVNLEYGDPNLDASTVNCSSSGSNYITNRFIGGGIFAKKFSGDTTLTTSNIKTWNLIAQAAQTGGLRSTAGFVQLEYPCVYSSNSPTSILEPLFGAFKVNAGDVIAIAGFASNVVSKNNVLYSSAIPLAKRYGGYSVELSII